MRRLGLATAVLCLLAAPTTVLAADAVEVSASDLLANPEAWNQQRVAIIGELVGDYSRRADGVWVQLNDDPYTSSPVGAGGAPEGTNTGIGARIPGDVFSDNVDGSPGRYGRHGPIVLLEGVFIHSDPDLAGESYLAVDRASTLTPGRSFAVPGPDMWLAVGVGLLLAAGAISWPHRRRRGAHD